MSHRDLRPCQTLPEPAQDDAEGALEQPLVSLSVGCDAIFLIGGAHQDVPPTALLLRSGDAVVMAGELPAAGMVRVGRVLTWLDGCAPAHGSGARVTFALCNKQRSPSCMQMLAYTANHTLFASHVRHTAAVKTPPFGCRRAGAHFISRRAEGAADSAGRGAPP